MMHEVTTSFIEQSVD